MFRLMKLEFKKVRIPVIFTILALTIVSCVLTLTLYKNYALSYELEAWEIGTEFWGLLFPLFVVIPLCWNLYYEKKDNFLVYVNSRISEKKYLRTKWLIYAMSAFCIVVIPLVISAIVALYVKEPIIQNAVQFEESATPFSHIFLNMFIDRPLMYAILLSCYRGILGILVMTFGFVFSKYTKNIFVILTGPFVYAILENFILAILQLEQFRLVTAFSPNSISPSSVSFLSFIVGPILLIIVMFLFIVYQRKKKNDFN